MIKYHVNVNKFSKIDSEESAYWLGFLYADGCLSENSRIGVMLQIRDKNHLEKLKNFLEWDNQVKVRQNGQYTRCELVFRCKPMFQNLLELGCHPRKSKDLLFPNRVQVPDNFLIPFIRGYCDGDGSLGKLKKGNIYYPRLSFCGTYSFIDEMLNRTKWKRNKIRVRKDGLALIEWQGKYAKEIGHLLYDNANIYLDRKFEIVTNMPF